MSTLYWYDYETYGVSAVKDRPVQFGGIRTTYDLEIINEPDVLYCKLPIDYLPSVEACMIHGHTPLSVANLAICEAEFAQAIHTLLSHPGNCAVGYNAMRFDHVLTQHLLYRNLRDPYGWHWRNGNSKWDIIDLVRAACALRPEGIEWPLNDDGISSFRLGDLASANRIVLESAHEAVSDVKATIDLARLVKRTQPRLYDYFFSLRDKAKVRDIVCAKSRKPIVHTSSMIRSEYLNTSLVLPLAPHPAIRDATIVYDLRNDPSTCLNLSLEEMRKLLFSRNSDIPKGATRPALKVIHHNRCPFVAMGSLVTTSVAERISINLELAESFADRILQSPSFIENAQSCYKDGNSAASERRNSDVDYALYEGGFVSDGDKSLLEEWLEQPVENLSKSIPKFNDYRLPELAFRYVARNYPDLLLERDAAKWQSQCRFKLLEGDEGGLSRYEQFCQALLNLKASLLPGDDKGKRILDELCCLRDEVEAFLSNGNSRIQAGV
jgi:exodeoxyribonuclease-1